MNRLTAVLLAASLSAASHLHAQIKISPQVGLNVVTFTTDLPGVSYSASPGFQAGIYVRFGNLFHLQPGVFWQRSQSDFLVGDLGLSGDVKVDRLFLPVKLGIKPIPLGVVDLRLNAGPALSIVTKVEDSLLGLTKDDYNKSAWGLLLGAGLDIFFLSTEFSYEIGLSNVIETERFDTAFSSKGNVFRVNAGLRF